MQKLNKFPSLCLLWADGGYRGPIFKKALVKARERINRDCEMER